MKLFVPMVTRLRTRHADTQKLWEYYWDTIAECVPPETIVSALRQTGFVDVAHRMLFGCLSEYMARKPPSSLT